MDPNQAIKDMFQQSRIVMPHEQQLPTEEQILPAIINAVHNVEIGLAQVMRGQYNVGMNLDATRLTVSLLVNMLVEEGLIDKTKWEEAYKVHVADRLIEFAEQQKRRLQEAMDRTATQEPEPPKTPDPQPQAEEHSDILLPSERGGGVKVFQ